MIDSQCPSVLSSSLPSPSLSDYSRRASYLRDMNYPCVKLFSEESISFPWNSSFKEVRDADLKAFLHQCGTAVSLIETELKQRQQQGQRKRPTGLEGYRERLRKCAARIKISQTLDKKQATDNAKIAATVMASNQTNRFDKIYQDILFDIARLCGPELVLLCAAALGKHRISHLNKDDQLHLLKFLQEKKRELNVNGLAALADLYEIPRTTHPVGHALPSLTGNRFFTRKLSKFSTEKDMRSR